MRTSNRLPLVSALALTSFSGVALAVFVNPFVPAFRGAPLAEYAGWEEFVSGINGSNPPDDPQTTPGAFFDLVQTQFGGLVTSGTIYNLNQASTFEITHRPDPAVPNPDLQTVVLQVRSIGNEFDITTFKLRFQDASGTTISLPADSHVELWRAPFTFGQEVEHKVEWYVDDEATVIDEYVLRFKTQGAHVGLDTALLDAQWANLGSSSYCTAGTSASGCQALLSASGVPSATAPSGFVVSAAGVEGAKDGLVFFGTNGRQANPWGNGTSFQCVIPPVKRAGLLNGTGSNGQCDGAFAQDLNALWCPSCPKPGKNPGAGALVQAQLWYRDPQNTSNQTTSLSDAIEFSLAP